MPTSPQPAQRWRAMRRIRAVLAVSCRYPSFADAENLLRGPRSCAPHPGSGVARTREPHGDGGAGECGAQVRDVLSFPGECPGGVPHPCFERVEVAAPRAREVGLGDVTRHVPEAGSACPYTKSGNPYCLTAGKPEIPTV